MQEILTQTNRKMQSAKCLDCGSTDIDLDRNSFTQSCLACGSHLEEQIMITSTSTKGDSGGLERQGQVTDMRSKLINFDRGAPENFNSLSNNIYKKEQKVKVKFQFIISKLGGDHPQFAIAIDNALRIWRLCFEKKLTRGYDGDQLAAILFYMACRQMNPPMPFLLLDFAGVCEINVYKLAAKFQKLCRDIPIEINSLTDPSIYISRFVSLLEYGSESETITTTACKLVDQMKQDYITTGRRPSGICGAAIFMASKIHGFKRTCKEISEVVNLSEGTIKKRVNEFLETKISTMTVNDFKSISRDEVNNNAMNRKEEELELPPIIKEKEKKLIKIQKKEEIKLKTQKKIEEYDKKYDNENDNENDTNSADDISVIIENSNNNNNSIKSGGDDIHSLMRPDPKQHTIFVAAKQTDDELINGTETGTNNSNSQTETQTQPQQSSRTRVNASSDKREMDASDDENINNNSNNNEDIDILSSNGNENGNESEMSFNNGCIGSIGAMSYITSATRSDLIEDESEFNNFNNDRSFIVGANATQLDEYDEWPCDNRNGMDNKQKIYKYYEDNDLTHLDNDPEVKSMILSEDEIRAKNKLFMVCNPDWIKVKKDMDTRAMIKEEKERKNKRKLGESYKNDPMGFVVGKVAKRFRSNKLNLEVFNKFMMGNNDNEKSPSVHIKKQDPLS